MAILVAALAIAGTAAQNETRSVQQGVYASAQADRGKAGYVTHCARCHGDDLGGTTFGDGVPALKRDDFMAGRNLKEVFDLVKRGMPFDAPSSLNDDAYRDVIAYVLQQNGYPAGRQDLPAGTERLQNIVITPRR